MQQSAELYAAKEKSLYIMVMKPADQFGHFDIRKFYLATSECDLHEMAWATAMQCRFTGHVRRRYSVAEHGVLVAALMDEYECQRRGGSPFEALMHDSHEGYVSDLAAPWKAKVPGYKTELESPIEKRMRAQFGLPEVPSEGVKYADWLALFIEAEQLLGPGATEDWLQPEPGTRDFALALLHGDARYIVHGFDPVEAYELFLRTYDRLRYLPR